MGTVISSGTVYVNKGEILDSPDILNTGKVYVNSGGSATNATIHDGGVEYVMANGTDMDANVSAGGTVHANTGILSRTHINNGGIISGIGATISSAVVNNGGSMALSGYVHQTSGLVSRGDVRDTMINSDGVVTLQKYAACSNTTINGGKLLAYSGTEVYGVNMTEGYILVDSASAYNVTMSGGSMLIRGEDDLNPGIVKNMNMSGGVAWIDAGGIVSNAALYKGTLRVQSGGMLEDAMATTDFTLFVEKGGVQYGGTIYGDETIAKGGKATNVVFTPFSTKHIYVYGSAFNCGLTRGSAVIADGGFFRGNITTMDTTGYTELVVVSGGSAIVDKASASNEGTWTQAILSGGIMDLNGGKIDWVYLKEGGTFNLGSGASIGISADVATGVMNVEGVLRDPRVSSGASVMISSGGIVTGRYDILNGAIVSAAEGATVDFDLTRTSAGATGALLSNLSLISGTPNYSLTVDGTQSVGSYKLAGGAAGFSKTLTVKDSAGTELGTITVDGDAVGYNGKLYGLKLTDGTLSVLVVNGSSENVFMGTVTSGTKTITSGSSAVGATVDEEGHLIIDSKGKASNTLVKAGGEMIVSSGGTVKGITIEKGGSVSILEDVMAQNVVVNGGMFSLEQYGWAYQTSKGSTVSSNTIVKNGGQVIVHESAYLVGAYVSDGGRVDVMSDGTFETGKVNYGEVYAFNGALVSRVDLEDGGILNVESGGIVRHINVSAGGVLTGVLREASELNFYGGTLDLDISAAAPGSEFLVDEQSYSAINMHPSEDAYYLCTLTVDDSQAHGTYQLIEGAYGFDQSITVVNTSGAELGTLTVGSSVAIGNDLYTLSQTAGDYSLLVTIEDKPEPTPPTPTTYIAKSDIDGNGVSDVMFVWTGEHGDGNYQHGYWMNGTSEWQSANTGHPANWDNLGNFDMTGDGKADSVLFGNVDAYEVPSAYIGYYKDGIDTDDNWVTIGFLTNAAGIAWQNKVGNMTGSESGVNSIAWYAPELGSVGVWTDGTENWVQLNGAFMDGWTLAGIGDFDGDGKDTVVMSYNGGQFLYTVGIGDSEPKSLGSANWSGWDLRAIGDFSGDGKDDIVLFHKESGSMVMLVDGNSDNYQSIGQLDKNDWFVVGAGDYNADGKDDLLVRQYSTGMLGYYNACDTSDAGWVEMGRGVDMQWTVIA